MDNISTPEHAQNWAYVNKAISKIQRLTTTVESIPEDEKKALLEEWEGQVWTENKPDINTILKNIQSLPNIRVQVPKWVMDRLKECLDDYVKQKWLSSIALAESISEYLTAHFIQEYISKNGIFSILKDSQKIKIQRDRINLLVGLTIINGNDKQDLELIK